MELIFANITKADLKDILVHLEINTKDFQYPRKGMENVIAFPKYKRKKDLLIRNSGRLKYDLYALKK